MTVAIGIEKDIDAHKWTREANEHYVEPEWCSERLFDVEKFDGVVQDPSCGFGRVVVAALNHGLPVFGSDIVDRGYDGVFHVADFFEQKSRVPNIASNPPFKLFKPYALHALELASNKIALLWLMRCLPAAGKWLRDTPLAAVYLLTPRPSMPPGATILAGEAPGGGTQEFCWLVWDHKHVGAPAMHWLHRDGK